MIFLKDDEQKIFCTLADPLAIVRKEKFERPIDLDVFVNAAELHDVRAVVCRNLMLLEKEGVVNPTQKFIQLKKDVKLATIVSMDLDSHRIKSTNALHKENISHRVVKGHSFSHDLYPNMSDRSYTDIDIMISELDIEKAHHVLASLNYQLVKSPIWDNSERNREFKYIDKDNPHILIELHTDLVHMSTLRRKKGLNFNTLEDVYNGGKRTIVGHFIVAIAHASLGHKFHNLKLLVDCLQVLRAFPKADIDYLVHHIDKLNFNVEVIACLNLCKNLFSRDAIQDVCNEIESKIGCKKIPRIVRSTDVINAPFNGSHSSRWRRRIFRLYQLHLA